MTVLQACVRQYGVHKGAFAAAHVAQWAITTAELQRVPTTVEYSEYWAISERTGWAHRAEAREVFGESWADVVTTVASSIGSARSPGKVMRLAVPAGAPAA